MSDDIIQGASGQQYRAFKVPKFIGYWNMNNIMKQPAEEKPSWFMRMKYKFMLGWTWHDGLDGL